MPADKYAKMEKGFVKLNRLFHDMTQNVENLAGVNLSLNRCPDSTFLPLQSPHLNFSCE